MLGKKLTSIAFLGLAASAVGNAVENAGPAPIQAASPVMCRNAFSGFSLGIIGGYGFLGSHFEKGPGKKAGAEVKAPEDQSATELKADGLSAGLVAGYGITTASNWYIGGELSWLKGWEQGTTDVSMGGPTALAPATQPQQQQPAQQPAPQQQAAPVNVPVLETITLADFPAQTPSHLQTIGVVDTALSAAKQNLQNAELRLQHAQAGQNVPAPLQQAMQQMPNAPVDLVGVPVTSLAAWPVAVGQNPPGAQIVEAAQRGVTAFRKTLTDLNAYKTFVEQKINLERLNTQLADLDKKLTEANGVKLVASPGAQLGKIDQTILERSKKKLYASQEALGEIHRDLVAHNAGAAQYGAAVANGQAIVRQVFAKHGLTAQDAQSLVDVVGIANGLCDQHNVVQNFPAILTPQEMLDRADVAAIVNPTRAVVDAQDLYESLEQNLAKIDQNNKAAQAALAAQIAAQQQQAPAQQQQQAPAQQQQAAPQKKVQPKLKLEVSDTLAVKAKVGYVMNGMFMPFVTGGYTNAGLKATLITKDAASKDVETNLLDERGHGITGGLGVDIKVAPTVLVGAQWNYTYYGTIPGKKLDDNNKVAASDANDYRSYQFPMQTNTFLASVRLLIPAK